MIGATSLFRVTRCFAALLAIVLPLSASLAGTVAVTSCLDDDGVAGGVTLRQAIGVAISGDTVSLSALTCAANKVLLTQGEILILQPQLTLLGPASGALTIASNGNARILHPTAPLPAHIFITHLTLSGGRVSVVGPGSYGGCILAAGDVTLSDSTLTDCATTADNDVANGGAISGESVILLAGSRITASATYSSGANGFTEGGGVFATSFFCTDSTVSGNQGVATAGATAEGGGAFVPGEVSLTRCTFDGNTADFGGAIEQQFFANDISVTKVVNSTISGNHANIGGAGLDVYRYSTPPSIQVSNSTFAFNTAPDYGGVSTNGSVVITSSILANSAGTVGADVYLDAPLTTTFTGANNLVLNTNATPIAGVITVTANPKLTSLGRFGGLTRTHSLTPGSPAIDHGSAAGGLLTDQRGGAFARTVGSAVDIGAYERQGNDDELFFGSFE